MARREEIERRVEEMLLPILDEFGFDLWDVSFVKEGKEYYPCHRVIGSNGSLTGYGGGLEIKRFLLDLESRTIL